MATETRASGTQANDSSAGTTAWSNPGNAAASDDSRSTASGSPGGNSQYLKWTNFGFTAIGDGDALTQLKLRVERNASGGIVKDQNVYLVIGGTIQTGTNFADTSTSWPGSDTFAEYTISSGLPTVAQLKASDFGFVVKVNNTNGFPWTANVDYGEVVATYTPVVLPFPDKPFPGLPAPILAM